MSNIRTDLACELRDEAMKKYAKDHKGLPDGIEEHSRRCGEDILTEVIDIKTEDAAALLERPMGKYITVTLKSARELDFHGLCDISGEVARCLSELIRAVCPSGKSAMFCGLGNRMLSADAIGPAASDRVIVTRHIKRENPDIYSKCGFFDLCVISPGVTAQTGMEAYEIIKSAVEVEKPDFLIVCDALAARESTRLAKTIQLSDSGISPGSGVGGRHAEISRRTVGIPVIAIGVPTVVDASTLAGDILRAAGKNDAEGISAAQDGLFVSPDNIDVISKNLALIIAFSVNRALHGNIPVEEMLLM